MRIPWGPMGPTGAPCGTHVGFTCFLGSFGSSPQASVRANNADIWSKEVGIIHSGPPSLSLSICNIRPSGTRPSLSLITSGSGSFGLHFGDGSGVCKFSIAKSHRPHCLVYPKVIASCRNHSAHIASCIRSAHITWCTPGSVLCIRQHFLGLTFALQPPETVTCDTFSLLTPNPRNRYM